MLYQTVMPVDAVELKEVLEDHLFQEAALLHQNIYCRFLNLYEH